MTPEQREIESNKEINLTQEFSGAVWAKEFSKMYPMILKDGEGAMPTEEIMLTWFCNAIMAGYDHANRKQPATELVELDEVIVAIQDMLGGHYNLYKKYFGEKSNPEDDICSKQLRKALLIIQNFAPLLGKKHAEGVSVGFEEGKRQTIAEMKKKFDMSAYSTTNLRVELFGKE